MESRFRCCVLSRIPRAIILALCLPLSGLAHQPLTGAQSSGKEVDESALRALVDQFFGAYATKDFDRLLGLWSSNSPVLDSKKKAAQETFASTGKIEVKSVRVTRLTIESDKADVRVAVEIDATDGKTGKQAPGFGKMNRALSFVKENGEWKLSSDSSAEAHLAEQLVAARSDEQRQALLEAERDLLTIDLRTALAARAFRLAVKGEYTEALAVVRLVQTIAERTSDKGGMAMAAMDSAAVYYLQGNLLAALASYRKVPPLEDIRNDRSAAAHLLSRRGFLGYYRKNFAQALDDCQRSLALRDPNADKAEIAFTMTAIGMIYQAQADPTAALEYYHRSLAATGGSGDELMAAFPLNLIGVVYYERFELDLALEYYYRSLALSRAFGIKSLLHYTLNNIGSALYWQGKYTQALDYYRESLGMREAMGNRVEMAKSLSNIADTYMVQHDYDNASRYYQQSLALNQASGNQSESSAIENRIGQFYFDQGNCSRALEYFQRSLTRARESNDAAGVADSLARIGRVHAYQGNYDLSLDFCQQSLSLLEALPNRETRSSKESIATTLLQLGDLYLTEGKHDLALQRYRRALDLASGIGNTHLAWIAQLAIGGSYQWRQKYAEALAIYQKCLDQARPAEDKGALEEALFRIALVHCAQGDCPQSLKYIDRALALAAESGNASTPWHLRALAGKVYRALNQFERARQALDEAISMIEAERLQVAGGEQERERFFENRVWPYHAMVDLLVAQKKPAEAFAYAERAKGRALLDVLRGGRVNITRSMTSEEKERERGVDTQMISLNAQVRREASRPQPDLARLADLKARLQKARLEHEAFDVNLYAAHPDLARMRGRAQPIKLDETGPLLPDARTALLEYVVTEDKSFLILLTRKTTDKQVAVDAKAYPIQVKQVELAARAESFRRQLAEHDLDFRGAATELYDLLLRPAQAELAGKSNLVIVPDGSLWQVPFQALQPAADRYLIQDAAVSYTPSLSVLAHMARLRNKPVDNSPAATSLFAVGNPTVGKDVANRAKLARRDERLEPLPEAETEVKTLAQFYAPGRRRVYVGGEATEARLKSEAGGYDVLHLAAHAVLDDASPMYSHIVLSQSEDDEGEDGLLEAWEMMKLDLRAKLVVLSACETARGRLGAGEGVIGMMWALFVAGCPTTVVSQWKVDSASTTELMVEFHRALNGANVGQARMTKAEALRQAGLKVMQQSKYRHPFYWAGFIVVGDGF